MHQPTLRVLEVLQAVVKDSSSKQLSDFSRELNIPKSTLLPILQTLCQYRYLSQDSGGYRAGTTLFSIGSALRGSFPTLDYVHSQLEALVQATGETCYFGVLEDGFVLYLDKVDSPHPLRMLTSVGHRLPAYATGIGKALLCDLEEDDLRRLYPQGLHPLTDRTITDSNMLAMQLAQARTDGYCWEVEESTRHIRCFAAPIRKNGRIAAAVSVAIPVFRYEEMQPETIIRLLQQTAAEISRTFTQTDAHFGDIF